MEEGGLGGVGWDRAGLRDFVEVCFIWTDLGLQQRGAQGLGF